MRSLHNARLPVSTATLCSASRAARPTVFTRLAVEFVEASFVEEHLLGRLEANALLAEDLCRFLGRPREDRYTRRYTEVSLRVYPHSHRRFTCLYVGCGPARDSTTVSGGVQVIQLNDQIVELTEELRQILGARFPLSTLLAPALGPIQVDPNQLRAAIVDIAAHARDSVPPGGRFVIETRSAALDEHHSGLRGGGYVRLLLTLTRAGMADLRRAHAFVKQTGGHITTESEPGGSTTINFYFPCSSQC